MKAAGVRVDQVQVPTELSPAEATGMQKLQRCGKFYAFLREIRGELCDQGFQAT